MESKFEDKRGREWEAYVDTSYFDMVCVRLVSDKDFNSDTSFHFMRKDEAEEFIDLLKISR